MPQLTTSRVPVGFAEATAPANGITINYVRGGTGPTLVLLHGYPQTWYMWRKVPDPAWSVRAAIAAARISAAAITRMTRRAYDGRHSIAAISHPAMTHD